MFLEMEVRYYAFVYVSGNLRKEELSLSQSTSYNGTNIYTDVDYGYCFSQRAFVDKVPPRTSGGAYDNDCLVEKGYPPRTTI